MAYTYLMNSDASHYWWFVKEHNSYLAANPDATEQQRKRPLRFIETLGVECALWSDLYPLGDMCETHVHLTDTRGLQRQRKIGHEFEPEADDEVGEGDEQRHSLRRSFLAKVQSPIMEYSGDFELMQFMHDLSIWSDLGGKVNKLRNYPLRLALRGAPCSPEYWKVPHTALLDMQEQCGWPVMFKMWSPYEWSAPYHEWLLHEVRFLCKERLGLATLEALHLAHIMTEMFRGWIAGGSVQARAQEEDGSGLAREPMLRDGRRRQEGVRQLRGAPGVPRRLAHGGLARLPRARRRAPEWAHLSREHRRHAVGEHTPRDGAAADFATVRLRARRPNSRTGSGIPVNQPSAYDHDSGAVSLQHTAVDSWPGVRAYTEDELDVMKFHQDTLLEPGRGLLLKYVAGYLPKFSDVILNETLDDRGTDF